MSDQDERERPESSNAGAQTSADADATAEGGSEATSSGGDGERMDLPKWNRARVKRKQPKGEEQDSFQAGVRKAGKAALTQAPVVIGLIVLVAGIIAGVVWYRGKLAEDRAVATRVLADAAGTQVRGRIGDPEEAGKKELPPPNPVFADEGAQAQRVSDILGQLGSEMEDSEANTLAALVRAARLMREGSFADAQASYGKFLERHSDHELSYLAREGLALSLEASGDVDAAVVELDTLAGDTGAFYRDQALFHKARMLEGLGKADEALTTYKLYVEEYPLDQDSLAREAVVERLKELAPELVPADTNNQGGFGLPPTLGG